MENAQIKTTTQQGQTSMKPFQDQEDSCNKCIPIKEFLKQAFREGMNEIANQNDKQGMCEDELAREISFSLQIKRKRDESCKFLLEECVDSNLNINNMQIVRKKQKHDAGGKWAEEAGLNKPHSKP
ncbi:hypothetical protein PIB30_075217 [Stylosanthes scabra]|uniref:Uncharacterized protein n=1 Tax=Stylosanthes scabra TaxID=79078 RepID=A0ABU6WT18_9FABA|nr:hypothetical protein [Stylosanthes scabra]